MLGHKTTALAVTLSVSLSVSPVRAQVEPHAGHHPPPSGADTTQMQPDSIGAMPESMSMDSTPGMMPERPLGIPMTRMGSGTAWLPDASAMRAWHFMAGSWMLMV